MIGHVVESPPPPWWSSICEVSEGESAEGTSPAFRIMDRDEVPFHIQRVEKVKRWHMTPVINSNLSVFLPFSKYAQYLSCLNLIPPLLTLRNPPPPTLVYQTWQHVSYCRLESRRGRSLVFSHALLCFVFGELQGEVPKY